MGRGHVSHPRPSPCKSKYSLTQSRPSEFYKESCCLSFTTSGIALSKSAMIRALRPYLSQIQVLALAGCTQQALTKLKILPNATGTA